MHIILGLIGLATAAYFLVIRARRGAEMASELMDVAGDIRAAARRFGFRKKYNQHPVESIEDPRLAIGALGSAFIALDDLPTADARAGLDVQLRKQMSLSGNEAQEIAVLGNWLVSESGGASQAVPRLTKKLRGLDREGNHFGTLMGVLGAVAQKQADGLSDRQRSALEDIKRIYRIT